jgi:uncharacterized membrane protein
LVASVAGVVTTLLGRRTRTQPVLASVTINASPDHVYAFVRRLERLPMFVGFIESVRELAPDRYRWVASLPGGGTAEWDVEIDEDVPGQRIVWRSTSGAAVDLTGVIGFTRAPGRDMTEVALELRLGTRGIPPSPALTRLFARAQVKGYLRRLKQVIETGEVLVSDATLHGEPHPAQPSGEARVTASEGGRS